MADRLGSSAMLTECMAYYSLEYQEHEERRRKLEADHAARAAAGGDGAAFNPS